MRVLVVGGAGYLGGALTDLLLKSSHDVIVYDSLVYSVRYMKNVPIVNGNMLDTSRLKRWLDWADTVVWIGGIVGDGACEVNRKHSVAVNYESVKWLADNFDGRIIFTSSCSVYGAQDNELVEESPTNPLSLYAETKLQSEEVLKNKNALIFRLGTLFGLSDAYSRIRLDLVVNTMAAHAKLNGKLKVFGGEQYRPLLHVYDAALAIFDNLDSKHTGIYNIHCANMKILDLAKAVQSKCPCDLEIVETPFEDSRNYKVSSEKAIRELWFNTTKSVEDGIDEMLAAVKEGDLEDPLYNNEAWLKEWVI